MMGGPDPRVVSCAVDVHAVLRRSVASLYSHLVTRPTGRAVRLAIEHQISELSRPTLSLVDLSSVAILDYSCADEVVARLLLRDPEGESGIFFVLTGVREHHLDPIEAVLQRHRLAVVGESSPGAFRIFGDRSDEEQDLWRAMEERRRVVGSDVPRFVGGAAAHRILERLVRRRLLFRDPGAGDLHALSVLVHDGSGTGSGPAGSNPA